MPRYPGAVSGRLWGTQRVYMRLCEVHLKHFQAKFECREKQKDGRRQGSEHVTLMSIHAKPSPPGIGVTLMSIM